MFIPRPLSWSCLLTLTDVCPRNVPLLFHGHFDGLALAILGIYIDLTGSFFLSFDYSFLGYRRHLLVAGFVTDAAVYL